MSVTEAADNSTPGPFAFMARVYRANLRIIVVPIALLTGVRTLVWYVGELNGRSVHGAVHTDLISEIALFKRIGADSGSAFPLTETQLHYEKELASCAIVLAVLYLAASIIEFFGVAAGALQRFALIRIYSFLSMVAAAFVIGAALLRVIVHFTLKDELFSECTTLASNQTVHFSWGIWGLHPNNPLPPDQVDSWCAKAWSQDSWSDILILAGEILFMGFLTLIVFSYARQAHREFVAPDESSASCDGFSVPSTRPAASVLRRPPFPWLKRVFRAS
ncbi:hypothetical protein BV25DRAFT_1916096 [Artomyces pyxidatus]|uniref:Uncharacterized protein n=1 Tax=Artomyces pyxidatus TaxID=48021 RepID=A0ACB8T3L3_9AGAM|nr:hypothetical protein BV25DRAFT_1916096 [Artomyces pyxidatus]